MKNYIKFKVFDCQWNPGMPDDVKASFHRIFEGTGNDVFVQYTVQNEHFSEKDKNTQWAQDKNLLDSWLIANGALAAKTDNDEGETVLIKHWW